MSNSNFATFYLVRHGQTDWNLERKIQGQTDIPLNTVGEQDAQGVAEEFKNIKFDLAFSSDLLRAKRTTEIIALEHKLTIQTTKLLRERHFGTLEGQPSAAFFTELKLLKELSRQERQKHKLNDGYESDEEFLARVLTFLRETAIASPGKNILVGTHGGTLRMLLLHLGEFSYDDNDANHIKNGGYIVLESDGVDFFLKKINGVTNFSNLNKVSL